MPIQNSDKPTSISAANISQLTFFVMPDGSRARTVLPDGADAASEIAASLIDMGFDIDREVGIPSSGVELWADADEDSPLREAICPGATLFFSAEGIAKLLKGGVSTPPLDALKNPSSSFVQRHAVK